MRIFIKNVAPLFRIALFALVVQFILLACGSAPVVKTNLKSVLNGTFVYSGSVEGGVPMTVSLKLNSGAGTFQYSEAGGINNRSYSGGILILGEEVVFTNSQKETTKHKVTQTANGIKLECVENNNPISFGMQPLVGSTLEFFKQ